MKPHRTIITPGKQKPRPSPVVMFAEQVFSEDDSGDHLTTTFKSDYITIKRGKYTMYF